jgi:hypothetical protein
MKVKIKTGVILPRDMACKGRPPKSPAGFSSCHRVRSEGQGTGKTYYTELFSTKTGKSVGFVGPDCRITLDPKLAERSNYLNRHNAEWAFRNCLSKNGSKAIKAALNREASLWMGKK